MIPNISLDDDPEIERPDSGDYEGPRRDELFLPDYFLNYENS